MKGSFEPRETSWRGAMPFLALAIVLGHAIAAWWLRTPGFAWGEDDAAYLLLAKELRHFSYRDVQDVLAPVHARFPPLFPLLLAVVGAPVADNLDVLLAFVALCSAGALLLFYAAARRTLGDDIALAALALAALNPDVLGMGGALMAEAPFTLFTMLALWALTHEDESPRFAVLAGAAVYLAALTRTAGVVFVVALFAYWIVRGRYRRAALFSTVAVMTIGVWLVWTFSAPDPDTRRLYVADIGARGRASGTHFLAEMAGRVPARARRLLTSIVPTSLALPTKAGIVADNVAWVVVLLTLGLAGVAAQVRRWQAAIAFLATYLLLLLVWRHSAVRFVTPVTPLLLALLIAGAAWLADRRLPTARPWVVLALVVVLGLGALARDTERASAIRACDRSNPVDSPTCWPIEDREALQVARWARDSTRADDLFFVSKERAFFYHSGRRSINQDRALRETPATIAAYLRSQGVRYAMVAPIGVWGWEHNSLIAQACRDFALVHRVSEATVLLRVREAGEADDDGETCRALAWWRPKTPAAR